MADEKIKTAAVLVYALYIAVISAALVALTCLGIVVWVKLEADAGPLTLIGAPGALSGHIIDRQPQKQYAGQQQYTGQQQYAQQPAPAPMGYAPIKTDRGVIGWLLLSIVTCGIYSYYFLYCLARDINVMCQDDGDSTPGLAAFILLSFVTCGFYALYWYYKVGNRLQANAPRYGLMFQENGTTVLMWQIVGALLCGLGPIFAMNIIIKNTNAMATAYNVRLGARA